MLYIYLPNALYTSHYLEEGSFRNTPDDFGRNSIFQGIDKFIKQVDEYMKNINAYVGDPKI